VADIGSPSRCPDVFPGDAARDAAVTPEELARDHWRAVLAARRFARAPSRPWPDVKRIVAISGRAAARSVSRSSRRSGSPPPSGRAWPCRAP
jgi:hypothetical protein